MCWSLLLVVVFSFVNTNDGYRCKRRVCYYTNWSQHRVNGQFLPEDIFTGLCDHLIFAFAKVENNTIVPTEHNDMDSDTNAGLYTRFNRLKERNPFLRTLLSVGGFNTGSASFSEMASVAENRSTFITTSIAFLRTNNFDGLDLDWEYPGINESPPQDKHKFTLLVQELAAAFQTESTNSTKPRLLLSAAVAARKEIIDGAYEVAELSKSLDMINLMSFDFHGGWDSVTGHNSPLYSKAGASEPELFYSTDYAVRYWTQLGAPKDKINVGLATYGRSFTLTNKTQYAVGDPSSGPGSAGPITQESGALSYYEICAILYFGGKAYYIEDQHVPFLVNNSQWVGYENIESITKKVRYVKDNSYGGIMIWSLDTDDFHGNYCGQKSFPLVTAAVMECITPGSKSSTVSTTPVDPITTTAITGDPLTFSTQEKANILATEQSLESSTQHEAITIPTELPLESSTQDEVITIPTEEPLESSSLDEVITKLTGQTTSAGSN